MILIGIGVVGIAILLLSGYCETWTKDFLGSIK